LSGTVSDRFFIVTGGPGAGKSTLIDRLEQQGFARSVEAGRAIIQDEMAIDGSALPWKDASLFAELMLSWEMRSYGIAQVGSGPVFFDRGVPDVVAYLRLVSLPVPEHLRKAVEIFRYNRRVFIAPPWQEIFQQDRERKQGFDEAVRTYNSLVETYSSFEYEVVEIPCISVEDRVRFVLENLPRDSHI
jgi:predicted ATPase